jgi:hypothetical protein
MYSAEDNRKDRLEWLNDPKPFISDHFKQYFGKTIQDIRGYGNGEEIITFTDGTRLLFSVENPDSGDDLYSKTETEFNFNTWKYREQEADEANEAIK